VGREAHELHGLDAPHPAVPIPLLFCFFFLTFPRAEPKPNGACNKASKQTKITYHIEQHTKKNEGEATAGTKEKT
jgi:hypothetical protein